MATKFLFLVLIFIGGLIFQGCVGVKPWERDLLSEPGMKIDPNPGLSEADDHIYFSREASKGERGFGGGGCGCN